MAGKLISSDPSVPAGCRLLFHRAHQAVYTDPILADGDRRWGILGVSLRNAQTRDALAPQDGLYTVCARSGADEEIRVIGSLGRILVAPEGPATLLAALCHPSVRIVSLTITEKGYCHRPSDGTLDEDHPDIRHDLANPREPRSAVGFIVAALARRRAEGLPPFVDLYNAISLRFAVPVGGENLDAYVGQPRLTVADGSEVFATVKDGRPAVETPDRGEVVWRDDRGVTCRRWNWRQGVRTRLNPGARRMWFILESLGPMPIGALHEASAVLAAGLKAMSADIRIETSLLTATATGGCR